MMSQYKYTPEWRLRDEKHNLKLKLIAVHNLSNGGYGNTGVCSFKSRDTKLEKSLPKN
jgi:hypothetical protein